MLLSCSNNVKNPMTMEFPVPTEEIAQVTLTPTQKGYVEAGNRMAFRLLGQIFKNENLVCSPLSLQYALAMTANGASGQTRQEIIDFLGCGNDGIDALNEYNKILLEQLPAVNLDVTLKATDALIVNDRFPLLPSYKATVEKNYYAPVDNMDFSDPEKIAARINDWAGRSTDGFIDKLLEPSDISEEAVAYIMNALYFKAMWAGGEYDPMFNEERTRPEDFRLSDGRVVKVDMMRTHAKYEYAEMDGYKVLVLPYKGGRFNMYILLPDKNDINGLVDRLQTTKWDDVLRSLKRDANVYVRLPKFDIENEYSLAQTLKTLGVERAFRGGQAEFDMMFKSRGGDYSISDVFQKSKIGVSEWGTEAGSVTFVQMEGAYIPRVKPKEVYFYIDRPFVFIIGEETSGTILFEGVCTRP